MVRIVRAEPSERKEKSRKEREVVVGWGEERMEGRKWEVAGGCGAGSWQHEGCPGMSSI